MSRPALYPWVRRGPPHNSGPACIVPGRTAGPTLFGTTAPPGHHPAWRRRHNGRRCPATAGPLGCPGPPSGADTSPPRRQKAPPCSGASIPSAADPAPGPASAPIPAAGRGCFLRLPRRKAWDSVHNRSCRRTRTWGRRLHRRIPFHIPGISTWIFPLLCQIPAYFFRVFNHFFT